MAIAPQFVSQITSMKEIADNAPSGNTGTGDGPVVAFGADTDGLPILEDTGMECASQATGCWTTHDCACHAVSSRTINISSGTAWRWLMP